MPQFREVINPIHTKVQMVLDWHKKKL